MHQSVVDWVRATLLPEMVRGKRVLDVGSLSVNGTMRDYFAGLAPAEFYGIDMRPGEAVDEVLDVNDLLERFGPQRWDLIVTTEMLEHCERWQNAIYQMKESLVVGGWLVLTTRSPGYPHHDHPNDHWRFSKETLMEALEDLEDVSTWSDPGFEIRFSHFRQPGVFIRGRRGAEPVSVPTVQAEPAPEPAVYLGVDPRDNVRE